MYVSLIKLNHVDLTGLGQQVDLLNIFNKPACVLFVFIDYSCFNLTKPEGDDEVGFS